MERGKLTQAFDCLQHAHKLAPEEDYILRHLKIVQQRIANLKQAPGMQKQKNLAFAKYDPTDFGGNSNNDNGLNANQIDDNTMTKNVESTSMPMSSDSQNQPDKSTIAQESNSINEHYIDENIMSNRHETVSSTNNNHIPNDISSSKSGNAAEHRNRHSSSVSNVIDENTLPIFVHDLDDPSSGTS